MQVAGQTRLVVDALGEQLYQPDAAGEDWLAPAQAHSSLTRSKWRASTRDAHWRSVARVVAALRERFAEPISLDEMARIAISSPFHFNRVFRQMTGLPPGRFVCALRIQAAKRLLVTTTRSVTKVCLDVGYSSLGTFSSHFTQYVGASPVRFRYVSRTIALEELLQRCATMERNEPDPVYRPGSVLGRVRMPEEFTGLVVVGLFRAPIPRGRPVACGFADSGGGFHLTDVPDGRFYLFGTALEFSGDPARHLVGEPTLRGRAGPLVVSAGVTFADTSIKLRPPQVTDPPILASLPVLIAERAAATGREGTACMV
jgi:AraC family transcriptional regulator